MLDASHPTGVEVAQWPSRVASHARAAFSSVTADGTRRTVSLPARLCVVVPTYNERRNLEPLVQALDAALAGVHWEMIIVDDDSPDGTVAHARSLHLENPRIRVIRRIGRRGLASACVEGMLATSAPFVAVMDGDLQHDPFVLRRMLYILEEGQTDLVAASRYTEGGSIGKWSAGRAATSRLATKVAHAVTSVSLSDPMSGFFAIRRELVDGLAPDLSAVGFKILLDIAVTAGPGLRIREVPLVFACRQAGDSKLSLGVAWDYTMMIADKVVGQFVPIKLIAALAIALPAASLHLLTLVTLRLTTGIGIAPLQAIASAVALVAVYTAENAVSCKPKPRRGWRWVRGLTGFFAASAIGLFAGVCVTTLLFGRGVPSAAAGLVGLGATLVSNYGAARRYSWCAA